MAKPSEPRLSDDDRDQRAQRPASKAAPAPTRGDARGDRDADRETVRDGREEDRVNLTEDELFGLFQDSMIQSVLPNLPDMPGYHVCWLTTNNPRDTIPGRIRMGYELITMDMLKRSGRDGDWRGASLRSGEYTGAIGINEMIAARIPLSLYNRYMRYVHDALPRQEEEKLKAMVQGAKEQLEAAGSRIAEEGDGSADIVQRAKPMPAFTS